MTLSIMFTKFFFNFYLFVIVTERERGRDTGRGRSGEPDVGLDPRIPGSHAEPKADA